MKNYTSAPLPFMGQKKRFIREFRKALREFDHATVFVDLFGGSGLLSHVTKRERPDARVIYNDFDDYHVRLENIKRTNALLHDIRSIVGDYPTAKRLTPQMRTTILDTVRSAEKTGYVDYIRNFKMLGYIITCGHQTTPVKDISTGSRLFTPIIGNCSINTRISPVSYSLSIHPTYRPR